MRSKLSEVPLWPEGFYLFGTLLVTSVIENRSFDIINSGRIRLRRSSHWVRAFIFSQGPSIHSALV